MLGRGKESKFVTTEEQDRYVRGLNAQIRADVLPQIEGLRQMGRSQMGDVDPVNIARKSDEFYRLMKVEASEQVRSAWMAENTSGTAEQMLIHTAVQRKQVESQLQYIDEMLPKLPEDARGALTEYRTHTVETLGRIDEMTFQVHRMAEGQKISIERLDGLEAAAKGMLSALGER